MKLINYRYGYNNLFNCSIHGKIRMSTREWKKVYKFLLLGSKRWLPSYPWIKQILKEDIHRKIRYKNDKGYLINIRVPATDALVKKYKLNNYKLGNYSIEVIK